MLELEGLTENLVNRGARVPLLGMHQVDMLYRMREQLEPLAISESLLVLSEADIGRLTDIHDRIEATDDVEEFIDLDREFHLRSYAGCAHRAAQREHPAVVELHATLSPGVHAGQRSVSALDRQR